MLLEHLNDIMFCHNLYANYSVAGDCGTAGCVSQRKIFWREKFDSSAKGGKMVTLSMKGNVDEKEFAGNG